MSAHNIASELFNAKATIKDPGNAGTFAVDKSPATINLVSAGAETRTMPNPTSEGAILFMHHQTDAGDITVTFSTAFTEDGDTTFVFSEAGQWLMLFSIRVSASTLAWRKVADYVSGSLSGLTATAAEINARAAAASRIVNVTDATTYSILAADSGKIHIMPDLTAACTLTLPTAALGLEYEFISKAVAIDAHEWIFKSPSATNFYLGGVSFADTDAGAGADEISAGVFSNGSSNDFLTVNSPGGGTRIYMICDGTNWIVNGQVFSTATPAFSDT